MFSALTLSVLLVGQLDGGIALNSSESLDAGAPPFSAAIYAGCPVTGEKAESRDGGWFLPTARAERTACLLASCEEDRKTRGAGVSTSTPAWVWPVTVIADVLIKGGIAVVTWAATRGATVAPP